MNTNSTLQKAKRLKVPIFNMSMVKVCNANMQRSDLNLVVAIELLVWDDVMLVESLHT